MNKCYLFWYLNGVNVAEDGTNLKQNHTRNEVSDSCHDAQK